MVVRRLRRALALATLGAGAWYVWRNFVRPGTAAEQAEEKAGTGAGAP